MATIRTSTLAVSTAEAKYLHAGAICVSGTITSTGTQTAADVYRLCHLPKGAKITELVVGGEAGGSGTFDFGVTEDVDILIDGASVGSAGAFPVERLSILDGIGYVTTVDTLLLATQATVVSASAGTVLRFAVTYHMD